MTLSACLSGPPSLSLPVLDLRKLVSPTTCERQLENKVAPPIGTPLPGNGTPTVPPAPPVSSSDVSALSAWLARMKAQNRRVLCLTGAGLSTESGIPDYRSPNGAYSSGFKPMTHQDFMRAGREGMANRKKYWIRSFAGWESFSGMEANSGHTALAKLQKGGYVGDIVTQNVDRLHQKGGSDGERYVLGALLFSLSLSLPLRSLKHTPSLTLSHAHSRSALARSSSRVLELHGTTHEVRCMDCDTVFSRGEVQRLIVRMNDTGGRLGEDGTVGLGNLGIAATLGVMEGKNNNNSRASVSLPQREGVFQQNPDGDVEIRNTEDMEFRTPVCPACRGGTLKPDVVFFGDSLPKERTEASLELAREAGGLLVVGSSVTVMSAYRLVLAAKEAGAEVYIVTVGETRADALADHKVSRLAGELLPKVVCALGLHGA